MERRRIVELSSASSFVSIAIALGMYVAAAAEWLIAIPLLVAGLLAFVAWFEAATAASNQQSESSSGWITKKLVRSETQVIQFSAHPERSTKDPGMDERTAA
ncbi:MAG: hypothetical protein IH960_02345 [Chloroflexi bacterium]|nr:hypothetical protein [Chloroflexota bacterium]